MQQVGFEPTTLGFGDRRHSLKTNDIYVNRSESGPNDNNGLRSGCKPTGQAFTDCKSVRNANDTNALTPPNYQDIARTGQEPDTSPSRDLARVKALFQQRAIVAHLKGGA